MRSAYDGIITDEEYRTFWISWQANEITVGLGHEIGLHEVLTLNFGIDTTNVSAVAVTSGEDSEASWRISNFEG